MTETFTDSDNSSVVEAISRDKQTFPDNDIENIYSPEFDIEVGQTIVSDQDNGTQQPMWRAEIVWTADDTNTSEEQYLAEHPAEAILGCVEKSRGGEL